MSIWHAGRSGPVDERRGHGGRACQRARVLRRRQSVRDHLGLFPLCTCARRSVGTGAHATLDIRSHIRYSTHASTLARSLAHILTHAGSRVCTHTIARAHMLARMRVHTRPCGFGRCPATCGCAELSEAAGWACEVTGAATHNCSYGPSPPPDCDTVPFRPYPLAPSQPPRPASPRLAPPRPASPALPALPAL